MTHSKLASLLVIVSLFLLTHTTSGKAESIVWTDVFHQGVSTSDDQCIAWHEFLDKLTPDNEFKAVTMKGTFSVDGITLTDPVAVQQLAYLLNTRTEGSVTADGHSWHVYIGCNTDNSCVEKGGGVELRIDDNLRGCQCSSDESFTVRPDIGNANWGGINAESCNSPSQTMLVEFITDHDSDSDGIVDEEDDCPNSNMDQTVQVANCNSGIFNILYSNGCTLSDSIDECSSDDINHGEFVRCVSNQLNTLKKADLITGREKGIIQRCAARSN